MNNELFDIFLKKSSNYCATAERCRFDLKKKFVQWNVPYEMQGALIEQLVDDSFIDEGRFASAFVNDKFKFNKWGRIKITAALMQRLIADDIISIALNRIDEDEYLQVCVSLFRKKLSDIDVLDEKNKSKIYNFLSSRGFEYEYIKQSELLVNNGDSE